MAPPRPIVFGNWKMHGLRADARALAAAVAGHPGARSGTLGIFPPATVLADVAAVVAGQEIVVGGQDCHAEAKGAFTGSLSATMLKDAGATAVIVGHYERRHGLGETDAMVRAKATAALAAGLLTVLCIGETEAERDAGATLDVVGRQLAGSIPDGADTARLVVAYEPVWAIGTGRTPTLDEIAEVHRFLRAGLAARLWTGEAARVRLLYGGSVKPGNAAAIFSTADVDGALVGGASLAAADFAPIVLAAG
jgi:triosephosphate isomerase